MEQLIKLVGGLPGAMLVAIWSLVKHIPGNEAKFNFYIMVLVLIVWLFRAIVELARYRGCGTKFRRSLLQNVLPLAAVSVLFLLPYQYPTAFPLRVQMRSENRQTNRLIQGKHLGVDPDGNFAIQLAPLTDPQLRPQGSSMSHLYVENRSFVQMGPFLIRLMIAPESDGLIYYSAVATPGDLRTLDGRYYYFLRRQGLRRWLTYDSRCHGGDVSSETVQKLSSDSWCLFRTPVESGSGKPLVIAVPRLNSHSSYDIYFEFAVKEDRGETCGIEIEYDIQSVQPAVGNVGVGALKADKEVCQ